MNRTRQNGGEGRRGVIEPRGGALADGTSFDPFNSPTWAEVLAHPANQDLTPEDLEALREAYFRDVVAPQFQPDYLEEAREMFDAETAPGAQRAGRNEGVGPCVVAIRNRPAVSGIDAAAMLLDKVVVCARFARAKGLLGLRDVDTHQRLSEGLKRLDPEDADAIQFLLFAIAGAMFEPPVPRVRH